MDFRRIEELEKFEIILDNLIDFSDDSNLDKFKEVFESLPVEVYDKILSLENLSFKTRDSVKFREILSKSKKVAKIYSGMFK